MVDQFDKKRICVSHRLVIGCTVVTFLALFFFYAYAHPLVPWCWDDWQTYSDWGASYIFFDLPKETLPNYNIVLNLLGSLFGYIAAFVIYPLCGDYIMSLVVVNAIAQAAFICMALLSILRFLYWLTGDRLCLGGTALFFLLAFAFMKTSIPANYLFNIQISMTLYCYNIPSYCAVAFSLQLIQDHLDLCRYRLDFRTSIMLVCLYFIMFSFLPAAVLLMAVSGTILLYDIVKRRRIREVICENWFFVLTLIMFLIKLYFEMKRTFGTSYLTSPEDFLSSLKAAVTVLLSSFLKTHILFKTAAIVGWGGYCYKLILLSPQGQRCKG